MNKKKNILKVLFIVSFIPIIILLIIAFGSMKQGSCIIFTCSYGKKAFMDELLIWGVLFAPVFITCLAYQIIYIFHNKTLQ